MSLRHAVKRFTWALLYRAGIFPSRWQLGNPFKIAELTHFLRDTVIEPHHRILDIGCGKGIQTQVLARRAQSAVGVDTSSFAIKAAEEVLSLSNMGGRVSFRVADIAEDGADFCVNFDHIFSISVIEHVDEYSRLLAKANELLKPGGWIHISVDSLGNIHDEDIVEMHRLGFGVKKYFTAQELSETLKSVDFYDVTVKPIFTGNFARERVLQESSWRQ